MGFFDKIKKETYINKLVRAYKIVYKCDDMTAINNLRNNYSFNELKDILERLKRVEEKGSLDFLLQVTPPFKE